MTATLEKTVDGCYTRLLRTALNVHWSAHITNKYLYGNLVKVTDKIRERRLQLAGHITRHPEEIAHNLLFWEPKYGRPNRGRKVTTYVDQLKRDTVLNDTAELKTAMLDRQMWREYAKLVRVKTRPK